MVHVRISGLEKRWMHNIQWLFVDKRRSSSCACILLSCGMTNCCPGLVISDILFMAGPCENKLDIVGFDVFIY